jgi:hypothetical protein
MKSQLPRPRATYAPVTRFVSRWSATPTIERATDLIPLPPRATKNKPSTPEQMPSLRQCRCRFLRRHKNRLSCFYEFLQVCRADIVNRPKSSSLY